MPMTLQHPEGSAELRELGSGRRRVEVKLTDPDQFSPARSWETAYPRGLIESILEAKGPAYLCDEIRRDEEPSYVALFLEWAMLAYVDPGELAGKRLLDFGCGSGASTAILARMFPETEIVGVELEERFLRVARERAQFYGNDQVRFIRSPSGERLPDGLGSFDFVSFSAVFEHLLPSERSTVLRAVWATLAPGGVLFLNQTPHRFYPHEYHTTGLPLLNYLPDRMALRVARRFSRRVDGDASW